MHTQSVLTVQSTTSLAELEDLVIEVNGIMPEPSIEEESNETQENIDEFGVEKIKDSVYFDDSVDSYTLFAREALNHSILTQEQEVELFRKMNEATSSEMHNYWRNKIIDANYKLVVAVVKNRTRNKTSVNMGFQDLISEGVIGMIYAAEKYDYTRGTRFSTYATKWIRKYLQMALAQDKELPMPEYQMLVKIKAISSRFLTANGREPTINELADIVDIQPSKVEILLRCSMPKTSVDADPYFSSTKDNTSDNGPTLEEFLRDPSINIEDEVISKMDYKVLMHLLKSCLNEETRTYMMQRYGLEGYPTLSYASIAAGTDYSAEYVRKKVEKATALIAYYNRTGHFPPKREPDKEIKRRKYKKSKATKQASTEEHV